jgi:hypothetical protein
MAEWLRATCQLKPRAKAAKSTIKNFGKTKTLDYYNLLAAESSSDTVCQTCVLRL